MLLRLIGSALLVLALLVPVSTQAGDAPSFSLLDVLGALDEPVLPDEWGGIWEIDTDIRLCGSSEIFFSETEVDTLCPGETVDTGDGDPDDPTVTIVCSGTATATIIDMTCTITQTSNGGACTITSVIDYDATLSGDSYTADIHSETTAVGDCLDFTDFCTDVTVSGTKIGPAPGNCLTPVEGVSWGTIKNLYE